MSAISGKSCSDILDDREVSALGLAAKSRTYMTLVGDAVCIWEDTPKSLRFDVSAYPSRDILVDTYRAHLTSILEPAVIDGLPATREKSSPDAVVCTVTVGTGPNQGIETTWFGTGTRRGPRRDPCESATAVTRTILAKLPPAR